MNIRICQMKTGYCNVEYNGNALRVSNLEHQVWREINFSVMLCFILCNSIQLFTPHQALFFTQLDCIIHQLLGRLVISLPTQMSIIDVSLFVSILLFTELSCMCSFYQRLSFFSEDRISCLVKRGNEK